MLSSTTSSRSGLSPDIPEDTEKSMFSPCNSKQQKSVELYHTNNGQKDGKGKRKQARKTLVFDGLSVQ